jgi:hypothetical protein
LRKHIVLTVFFSTVFISCNSIYKNVVGAGTGQQYNNEYGKPLIVLVEIDPWAGPVVPSFVMYEKGQIIYSALEGGELKIYQIKFSKDQLADVIKSFEIPNSIYDLPTHLDAVSWYKTDQPGVVLIIDTERRKTISIYGIPPGDENQKEMEQFMVVYNKGTSKNPI